MFRRLTVQFSLSLIRWSFLFACILPSTAHAADGDVAGALGNIFTAVLAFATPFVLMLALRGVKAVEKRLGIDLSDRQEKMVLRFIEMGINFAEEKALNAAKAGAAKLSSAEKLQTALKFVEPMLASNKIDLSSEHLQQMIEAVVNKRRG